MWLSLCVGWLTIPIKCYFLDIYFVNNEERETGNKKQLNAEFHYTEHWIKIGMTSYKSSLIYSESTLIKAEKQLIKLVKLEV